MNNYEHILEFDKIKEEWAAFALTDAAKKKIAEMQPFLAEAELRKEMRETTEARTLLDKYGNPPLVSLSGVGELTAAAVRGECLSAGELEGFAQVLVAVHRLKSYLARCKGLTLSLPYYEENLDAKEELAEEISMQVRGGAVCDNASKLLRSLRGDIERAQQTMREKAEAVMRTNKECMSDHFATQRNGHICVPVKKEYKFRISGNVIDKSATGNTIFMEPLTVAKYYEELVMLRIGEEEEVRRILYALTAKVAEIADVVAEDVRTIEKLDYIFSKGKLSQEYGGVEPEINLEGRIVIENGRHPLMDKNVCVPLQFRIGGRKNGGKEKKREIEERQEKREMQETEEKQGTRNSQEKEKCPDRKEQIFADGFCENEIRKSGKEMEHRKSGKKMEHTEEYQGEQSHVRGIVITGPNTGGKTVAIKTVALACLMAQCGLHVTCEKADLCMRSNYLCDIGDGQSLSENLSTFSAHIVNVLEILKNISQDSLVILDELGSGTDPAEGMGLAVAILEELKRSGALFVVTTHYPEVKQYAAREAGICNARMTFDRESLKPTYRLVIGEAGESCAFYIAARYGMPERMLQRAAQAAYGESVQDAGNGNGSGVENAQDAENRNGSSVENVQDAENKDAGIKGNARDAKNKDADIKGNAYDIVNGSGKDAAKCGKYAQNSGSKHTGNAEKYTPLDFHGTKEEFEKKSTPKLVKQRPAGAGKQLANKFHLGDSVMLYPDKKLAIVCEPVNEKGVLRVQLPDKKIWINHKRVKLVVAAEELYPADYDFSIIFDTPQNRKLRHDMERKYVEGAVLREE